jgi:chemotaxis protein CheX
MVIQDTDISAIVDEVWNGFIGLETWPAFDPDEAAELPALDGRVEIDGAWEGAVLVRCPVDLARRAAAQLLGGEPGGPDEVLDAVGEIANQIGSNIRSLLPGPTTLSLPAVRPAGDGDPAAGSGEQQRLAYACEGELFTVAVVARG